MKKISAKPTHIYATLCLLCGMLLPATSMSHPLKLSASLVAYDAKAKSLRLECKVFRDDFERSLSYSVLKGVDPSTLKESDKPKIIETYFEKYYKITHNGKAFPLKLKSSQYLEEQNVLIISFAPQRVKLRKGDKIKIENTLFFEEFGFMQTNRIYVRIPSFSIEDNHVATFDDYQITYTL